MIFSKNEKWKNSSILTKVSLVTMLLNSLLLLICTVVVLSWNKSLSPENRGIWILFLITFLFNALLSFGIFKVNGIARIFAILQGLFSVLMVVFGILGVRYALSLAREMYGDAVVDAAGAAVAASSGLIASLFRSILSAIPRDVLAQIGFYLIIFIGPYIFQLLSMLILLVCGKDFKKPKVETS